MRPEVLAALIEKRIEQRKLPSEKRLLRPPKPKKEVPVKTNLVFVEPEVISEDIKEKEPVIEKKSTPIRKKQEKKIDFRKIAKYAGQVPYSPFRKREYDVIEDKKKTFKRPPTQYNNTSPYGIASKLHNGQDLD